MIGAHRDRANRHTSKVDRFLAIENEIRLPKLRVSQQVRDEGRAPAEGLRQLEAELIDVLHLVRRAQKLGAGRKRVGAEVMFGMEVRCPQIEVTARGQLA